MCTYSAALHFPFECVRECRSAFCLLFLFPYKRGALVCVSARGKAIHFYSHTNNGFGRRRIVRPYQPAFGCRVIVLLRRAGAQPGAQPGAEHRQWNKLLCNINEPALYARIASMHTLACLRRKDCLRHLHCFPFKNDKVSEGGQSFA